MTYSHAALGTVSLGRLYYHEQVNQNKRDWITAGFVRRKWKESRQLVSLSETEIADFRATGDYPRSFAEKCRFALQEIYTVGKDGKAFEGDAARDCTIFYCEGQQDLRNVLQRIADNGWTTYKLHHAGQPWFEARILPNGIAEVEKGLPQIPLFALVNQDIATGDEKVDEQINHARRLFHKDLPDMSNMRSAVIALARVLEPLRDEMKKYFGQKDTETFFQLVNEFDVRHNKDRTKSIEHPEQLEWLYYGLLNTIACYTKLRSRLSKL